MPIVERGGAPIQSSTFSSEGPRRARSPSCILVGCMPRLSRALWFVLALGAALLAVGPLHPRAALAGQGVGYLIEQLKTAEDYRIRTQAALGLGASGDDAAVKPLCDALGDGNASVKVAAAAALGKLGKPAGLPCLKGAQGRESAASVKAQIDKSIATLDSGGSTAPAAPGSDTRVYVAIQVTNKTTRPAAEVDALVRAAMTEKILAKKGYAVAPKTETSSQGGQIIKSKKLKGYFLMATVEPPIYGGGDLSQVVRVSMWTYPGKALQGEFAPKLTQSGTPKGDTQSESMLMKMCVENAVETFQKVAASM